MVFDSFLEGPIFNAQKCWKFSCGQRRNSFSRDAEMLEKAEAHLLLVNSHAAPFDIVSEGHY